MLERVWRKGNPLTLLVEMHTSTAAMENSVETESLGLQGDQTSQYVRKFVLNIHWKDWCWSWNSNTPILMWRTDYLEKTWDDAGKDWRQEGKWTPEDEMVGWHHWLVGHEFEQAPGVGEGQGSLVCCSPWGHKESDTTEQLNWTELNYYLTSFFIHRCISATVQVCFQTTRVKQILQ